MKNFVLHCISIVLLSTKSRRENSPIHEEFYPNKRGTNYLLREIRHTIALLILSMERYSTHPRRLDIVSCSQTAILAPIGTFLVVARKACGKLMETRRGKETFWHFREAALFFSGLTGLLYKLKSPV